MKRYTPVVLFLLASCSGSNDITTSDSGSALVLDGSPSIDQPVFDDQQTLISRNNYESLIATVFSVYSGQHLREQLLRIPYLPTQFGGSSNLDDLSNETYACVNGGTVSILTFTGSFSTTYDVSYDNCQYGEDVFTGTLVATENGESVTFNSVDNLQMQLGSTTVVSYAGQVRLGCCQSNYDQEWETLDLDYQLEDSNGLSVITNADVTFTDGIENSFRSAFLRGAFSLNSPLTFNRNFAVSIDETFSYDSEPGLDAAELELLANNWSFGNGKMTILAEDGSSIVLNAENGDPDSVRVTIDNGQESESFDQAWSLWRPVLVSR